MHDEKKRSSKWDKGPETENQAKTDKTSATSDNAASAKLTKHAPKSKWDILPEESKWDVGPSGSKWDIRPEDVANQNTSGEDQAPTTGAGIHAAAEAAARVNAMLMAKGTLKPAEPLLVNENILKAKQAPQVGAAHLRGGLTFEVADIPAEADVPLAQQHGRSLPEPTDFEFEPANCSQRDTGAPLSGSVESSTVTSEVEINDVALPCRNLLTRGITQDDIFRATGASVSTKGRYMTAEEWIKCPGCELNVGLLFKRDGLSEKRLHLSVHAPSQESVDKAVARIREIMGGSDRTKATAAHSAVTTSPFSIRSGAFTGARPTPQPLMSLTPSPTGLAYIQEKLFIGLEHAGPAFGVTDRILGPAGSYLTHVQIETGAKVLLRGKGSNFIEPTSGREAFEPMYIYIQHPTPVGVQQAKQLATNLINTVHEEYAQWKQSMAAMPPTVLPGTATMLASLHPHHPYQQQQQFAPLLPPHHMLPRPGIMSAGLSTMPPTYPPGAMPTNRGSSGFQRPLPPPQFRPPGFAPSWQQQMHTSAESQTPEAVTAEAESEPSTSDLYDPLEGLESDDDDADIPPSVSQSSSAHTGPRTSNFHPAGFFPPPVSAGVPRPSFPVPPPGIAAMPPRHNPPFPPHRPSSVPPHRGVAGPPSMPAPPMSRFSPFVRALPGCHPPVTLPPPSVTTVAPTTHPVPPTTAPATDSSAPETTKSSSSLRAAARSDPSKRKFREEKEEDSVPDDLLGYQHGPLHLKHTLTGQAAPNSPGRTGASDSSSPAPRSAVISSSETSRPHGAPNPPVTTAQSEPRPSLLSSPVNGRPADRLVTTSAADKTMPRPSVPTSQARPMTDSFVAPVAPVSQHVSGSSCSKKAISINLKPPQKKKLKGALVSVAMSYHSDEDSDASTD